jgi:hypothetical protein
MERCNYSEDQLIFVVLRERWIEEGNTIAADDSGSIVFLSEMRYSLRTRYTNII